MLGFQPSYPMEKLHGLCLVFFYTFAQEDRVWHGVGVGLNQHTWGGGRGGISAFGAAQLGAIKSLCLGEALVLSTVACSPCSW